MANRRVQRFISIGDRQAYTLHALYASSVRPYSDLILYAVRRLNIIIIFWAHQHKAAGLKNKLSEIKMVATASYSVTIVLWKETAFPL